MRSKAIVAALSGCVVAFAWSNGAAAHEPQRPCGAAELRLTCDLIKKTKVNEWEDYWNTVVKAHVFLCFNNRGGNNEWVARIDHYDKDDAIVSSPLSWFNTVLWGGDGNITTWKGTGARLSGKGTSMLGQVTPNKKYTRFAYTEKLFDKRKRVIRETQYRCQKRN